MMTKTVQSNPDRGRIQPAPSAGGMARPTNSREGIDMTDEEEKSLAFAADVMIEIAGYDEAFRYPMS